MSSCLLRDKGEYKSKARVVFFAMIQNCSFLIPTQLFVDRLYIYVYAVEVSTRKFSFVFACCFESTKSFELRCSID